MCELIICSRKEVPFEIREGKTYGIIAFYDYPGDKVQYPEDSVYKILELHVADVLLARDPKSMDEETALRIKEFADDVIDKADVLIVCCSAGISRSSATAAAIIRGNKMDDSYIWDDCRYSPNPLCYEQVLAAYGIVPKNTKALLERSRQALHNKIMEARG